MKKNNIFSYRTAAVFSVVITILMHMLFAVVALFGRAMLIVQDEPIPDPGRPDMSFEWFTISIISVFVFSFLMFVLNFAILKAELKRYRLLTIIIASTVATVAFTYMLLQFQILLLSFDLGQFYNHVLLGNMMKDFLLTLVIIFTSQILYLSNKKQQIAYENEKLLAENMKSRYETLKNQVDPHFLFNTLNTLNTMIKLDPEKAQDYVQKMSSVFRYTLQNKEEITLEEELHFTNNYCQLMQIRYGESLQFDFHIDPALNTCSVIPLSIQTLVENAIKHNVITKRQPLTVSIYTNDDQNATWDDNISPESQFEMSMSEKSVSRTESNKISALEAVNGKQIGEDGKCCKPSVCKPKAKKASIHHQEENNTLTVSNPLQEKKEAEHGEGIGLANLIERYRLRFQKEPEVSCTNGIFKVTLPLIKHGKQ